MEQSHSAQHSQMLPRNMTNKKDFQLRSDNIARGEYLHPSVEQAFRASKQSLPGWEAMSRQCRLSSGRKKMCFWSLSDLSLIHI